MNTDTDLNSLHLHYIRSRCAEESQRFSQRQEYDPRFCYELFRRAILNYDQRAWEYVYQQYQTLVAGWVRRHPLFPSLDEDQEFFVNRVFEKMWTHLTPEKFQLSPGLSAVLSYLHKCVNSVLVDAMRKQERFVLMEEGEQGLDMQASSQETPEAEALNRDMAARLWAMLEVRCKDSKEHAIAYGSFVLALKATQIYSEYQNVFNNIQEVYRVKENLLARLKRDQELVDFLENP
ncbi:MAG: RNA polymerase sigma factor [Omnitrophica WOR_2 bacterium]